MNALKIMINFLLHQNVMIKTNDNNRNRKFHDLLLFLLTIYTKPLGMATRKAKHYLTI